MNINTDDAKYKSRAWRTNVLRQVAGVEVTKMLQAFVPEKFYVDVVEQETEVPGFPHAPNYKFTACLQDKNRAGSDAHIMVAAHTRQGALAKLLAYILDDQGFFPLT